MVSTRPGSTAPGNDHGAAVPRRHRRPPTPTPIRPPAGTLSRRSHRGTFSVGLLDGGRGLADTCSQVNGPDRTTLAEETVDTRTIDGREATNRAGAAEWLGMTPGTIKVYSSPGQRSRFGFPEPLPDRIDGQDWWLLEDLDRYAETRTTPVPAVTRPRELIDLPTLAKLRNIQLKTARRYWQDSQAAWEQGHEGYLPRPDKVESGPRGAQAPYWRRDRAMQWAFPGTRRSRGRQPGRRPVPEDLRRLRAENPGQELTMAQEAALLSAELGGVEVSIQVIRRLRKRLLAEAEEPRAHGRSQPDS